jgi:hypothetical protein
MMMRTDHPVAAEFAVGPEFAAAEHAGQLLDLNCVNQALPMHYSMFAVAGFPKGMGILCHTNHPWLVRADGSIIRYRI